MNESKQTKGNADNVILFPKTVEYYQMELTRLLESERYGEAVKLLKFLLDCRTDDARAEQEWDSLLNWLETMFPESAFHQDEDGEEQEEETEADVALQHVQRKTEQDALYGEKLLDMLEHAEPDKQMLAIEQLAYIDDSSVDEKLRRWLCDNELHPGIQFKALQTLKRRGAAGLIELTKWGETVLVDIEDTPLSLEQFPAHIADVVTRIREISEINQPSLSLFAEESWQEFVAFVYGTSIYRQMLHQEAEAVDVWASALHVVLEETMFQHADREEINELYGITSSLAFQWEQAYRAIKQYARLSL